MTKLERKSIHTVEEVLSEAVIPMRKKLSQNRKMMDGDLVRMDSHRYWVFKMKGIRCVCCGIEGKYFAKERHVDTDNFHFNLYAINSKGKEVLMTKDHIFPKSRGGKDHIDNYQPMCVTCNMDKADKLPHDITRPYKYKQETGVLGHATKSKLSMEGYNEDSNKRVFVSLLA